MRFGVNLLAATVVGNAAAALTTALATTTATTTPVIAAGKMSHSAFAETDGNTRKESRAKTAVAAVNAMAKTMLVAGF